MISTGGTIAGEVADAAEYPAQSIHTAQDFSDIIAGTLRQIKQDQHMDVSITPFDYQEIDSSDIKPQHWCDLAEIIQAQYDQYDAFIITHGTNTLGYTAAALSFALQNNGKRVVLTGSQVPMGQPGSDAKTNLDNAIRIACWQKHPIHGVVAVFGSRIISGTRVKKSTEFDYDAFQSFQTRSLGRIGRIIDINEDCLARHNRFYDDPKSGIFAAQTAIDLVVDNRFNQDLVSLTEFPGMNAEIFKTLVTQLGIKGIILRAFGAGDVAHSLTEGLQFLKQQHIPIVITTQAPNGNANMEVNEPGQFVKTHALGIAAHDMSIEALTTKLSWLLAKQAAGEIDYQQLCAHMICNFRGEIDVKSDQECV